MKWAFVHLFVPRMEPSAATVVWTRFLLSKMVDSSSQSLSLSVETTAVSAVSAESAAESTTVSAISAESAAVSAESASISAVAELRGSQATQGSEDNEGEEERLDAEHGGGTFVPGSWCLTVISEKITVLL